jgi:hypothetical protein
MKFENTEVVMLETLFGYKAQRHGFWRPADTYSMYLHESEPQRRNMQ